MAKSGLRNIAFILLGLSLILAIASIVIVALHFRYTNMTWTDQFFGYLGAIELACIIFLWLIIIIGFIAIITTTTGCLVILSILLFLGFLFVLFLSIIIFIGTQTRYWNEALGCDSKYKGIYRAWRGIDVYIQAVDETFCGESCKCYFNRTTYTLFSRNTTTAPYLATWFTRNVTVRAKRIQDCPESAYKNAYNKYFDIRKDCSLKLSELVFKEKNFNKISEKTKMNNWNVINDALKIFGIKYSKNELNKVVSGNNAALLKIITNIFNTVTQLLKYTKRDTNKDNNGLNTKSRNIRDNNNLNLNMNFNTNKNSNSNANITLNESNININNNKILQKENSSILNTSQNEVLKSLNADNNNINENNIINNINNINTFNANDILNNNNRPLREYVNIDKISANTLYDNCTSTLEFFIVSLCKNFKLKPIQAIGLLSNNRQYLSVLCRSGINGNYITIKKWLEDLQINYDILLKLIFKYEDGIYMSYCIIGTALCSKNYDISLYAVDLLHQLYKNVGFNKDWFIKIGINSFIFTFIKHEDK